MDTPTLIVTITSQILSFSSAIIVFVLGVIFSVTSILYWRINYKSN